MIDFITCPLCQKLVYLNDGDKDNFTVVSVDDDGDFSCPTYVDICPGRRWCHFTRSNRQAWGFVEYSAIIPPFSIYWRTSGELEVSRLIAEVHSTTFHPIYRANTTDFEEFIRTCNRFKNLKVFS